MDVRYFRCMPIDSIPFVAAAARMTVPRLPAGYAGMVPLALFPPLWFALMYPRVAGLRAAQDEPLSA